MNLDIGPAIPRKLPEEERFLAARRQTGFGEYMGAMSGEGWWNTIAGQGRAQVLMQEGKEADPSPLARDAWEGSPWQREGLDWFEGLTEGQARARAEVFDENAYRRWVIEQRGAGVVGTVAGFGAMLGGSIPTPENLIPIGPAFHAARVARHSVVLRQGAVAGGVAGLAGTAAFAPPVYYSAMQFGDDITFADVLLDLSVGAILGAGLGVGAAALTRWNMRAVDSPTVTQPELQTALDALAMGAQDLAAGRSPNVALHPDVEAAIRTAARREIEASVRVTAIEPPSLLAFLRRPYRGAGDALSRVGGLRDDAGELASRDLRRLRPGLVSRQGMSLDDATLAAWEAGYLGSREGPRPTPDDLLRAIDEELAGRKVYSGADAAAVERLQGQRQAAADFDDMEFRRDEARGVLDEMGVRLSDEQIDQGLTRFYAPDNDRDLEDIFADIAEADAMMSEGVAVARSADDVVVPFDPMPRATARPRAHFAGRNPVDPDLEPVVTPPRQADGAETYGIDAVDQATMDRFVAELDARGLIPDEIRAELEEAAALEAQAARSTEAYERAAWCVIAA